MHKKKKTSIGISQPAGTTEHPQKTSIGVIIEKKENIDTNSIKGKRKEMDIDAIEEKKEVQDDKEKSNKTY